MFVPISRRSLPFGQRMSGQQILDLQRDDRRLDQLAKRDWRRG
jgi:hypothetical protein